MNRLSLESLESRDAPAVASLSEGLLSVLPDASETGYICQMTPVTIDGQDQIRVLLANQAPPTGQPISGPNLYYLASEVSEIFVRGGRLGRNDINLSALNRPATILCGDAGDYTSGGAGPTSIRGGRGRD